MSYHASVLKWKIENCLLNFRKKSIQSFTTTKPCNLQKTLIKFGLQRYWNEPDTLKLDSYKSTIPEKMDASPVLAKLCYCIVRKLKPYNVVETGVARGVTSAFILYALEKNGIGKLYSIEFPPFKYCPSDIGKLVPDHLRSRWYLILGVGIKKMRQLTKTVPLIDIFIHDSDHSYRNQFDEYKYAYSWLNNRGFLVSDDVLNMAFEDVCGHNITLLDQNKKSGFVGIHVKTSQHKPTPTPRQTSHLKHKPILPIQLSYFA